MGMATEHRWCFKPGSSGSFFLSMNPLMRAQIAWLSIGLASWRFRKAWVRQGRPLSELKFRAAWTWPWGPFFVVRSQLTLPYRGLNIYLDRRRLCDHSQ